MWPPEVARSAAHAKLSTKKLSYVVNDSDCKVIVATEECFQMLDVCIQQSDKCDRKILEATERVAYEELTSFQQPSVSCL